MPTIHKGMTVLHRRWAPPPFVALLSAPGESSPYFSTHTSHTCRCAPPPSVVREPQSVSEPPGPPATPSDPVCPRGGEGRGGGLWRGFSAPVLSAMHTCHLSSVLGPAYPPPPTQLHTHTPTTLTPPKVQPPAPPTCHMNSALGPRPYPWLVTVGTRIDWQSGWAHSSAVPLGVQHHLRGGGRRVSWYWERRECGEGGGLLVQVGGVEVGPDGGNVEARDGAHGMRSVD